MADRIEAQSYALAGMLQATSLVGRLARTGLAPQDSIETSLGSLFIFDANHVAEIYRGHRGLTHGFRILDDIAAWRNLLMHGDAIRYTLEISKLVPMLKRDRAMLGQIREGLERIAARGDEDLPAASWLAEELSVLYQESVSTLRRRIRVTGDARHLQQPGNADRIRALLLAGIRSAMLWGQVGGSTWNALLRRGAYRRVANHYLGVH